MLGNWSRATRTLRRLPKRVRQFPTYNSRLLSSGNGYRQNLRDHLESVFGIDATLHDGIFKAMESVYGNKLKKEHLDTFGKEDIKALAMSVEQEASKRRSTLTRPSTTLRISVPHRGTSFDLKWRVGESLLELAQNNQERLGEFIEGTCGGNMSCCTCHVYVDQPELQKFLLDPDERELDMLDLAYEPTESSRLGCQVRLNEEMLSSSAQYEVRIPGGVNNVWN